MSKCTMPKCKNPTELGKLLCGECEHDTQKLFSALDRINREHSGNWMDGEGFSK